MPSPLHLLTRLRFRHLQLLDTLEREGSLRKAALALHLTQPAMSKSLRDLEDMLGLQLYERSPSGLECTPAGRVLVRGARELIDDALRLAQEGRAAGAAPRLRLRLGVPPFIATTLLPAMLAHAAAQGYELAVVVHEEWGPALIDALDAGIVDLFITMFRQPLAAGPSNPLITEILFDEQVAVIAAPDDPLTRRRRVRWPDVADRAWILPGEAAFLRNAVSTRFTAAGLPPVAPRIESPLAATNIALVAAGLGLSAVPRTAMLEAARLGKIGALNMDSAPSVPPVQMVYRDRAAIRSAVGVVRDGIRLALDAGSDSRRGRTRRGVSTPVREADRTS